MRKLVVLILIVMGDLVAPFAGPAYASLESQDPYFTVQALGLRSGVIPEHQTGDPASKLFRAAGDLQIKPPSIPVWMLAVSGHLSPEQVTGASPEQRMSAEAILQRLMLGGPAATERLFHYLENHPEALKQARLFLKSAPIDQAAATVLAGSVSAQDVAWRLAQLLMPAVQRLDKRGFGRRGLFRGVLSLGFGSLVNPQAVIQEVAQALVNAALPFAELSIDTSMGQEWINDGWISLKMMLEDLAYRDEKDDPEEYSKTHALWIEVEALRLIDVPLSQWQSRLLSLGAKDSKHVTKLLAAVRQAQLETVSEETKARLGVEIDRSMQSLRVDHSETFWDFITNEVDATIEKFFSSHLTDIYPTREILDSVRQQIPAWVQGYAKSLKPPESNKQASETTTSEASSNETESLSLEKTSFNPLEELLQLLRNAIESRRAAGFSDRSFLRQAA